MASGRAPRAGAAEVRLMVATEERFRPASDYADRLVGAGAPITAWMRRDLIDWMIEVAVYFRLHAETIGLAVNFLDRYCSFQPVAVSSYQLAGVTALLLASKMRERSPPHILALADLCSGAYERIDIKLMERLFCHHLDWHMDAVTPHLLLYHLLPLCDLDDTASDRVRMYAELLLEVILPEGECFMLNSNVLTARLDLPPLAERSGLPPHPVLAPADPAVLGYRQSVLAVSVLVCSLAALRLLRDASIRAVFELTLVSTADVGQCCDLVLAQFATVFPGDARITGPMSLYHDVLTEVATPLPRPSEDAYEAEQDLQRVPEWVRI